MTSDNVSVYRQVLADRSGRYNASIDSGLFHPFVYPWDSISALFLFLALLFLPRLSPRPRIFASLTASCIIAYSCYETVTTSKSLNFAGGYGPGLVCAWGMIMTMVLVIVSNPATDFQRLETRVVEDHDPSLLQKECHSVNGSATISSHAGMNGNAEMKQRKVWGLNGPASRPVSHTEDTIATTPYKLVWQGYPSSMGHRIDWVMDLMTSFRGPNWDWRISSLPNIDILLPDNSVSHEYRTSHSVIAPRLSTSTLSALHRQAIIDFIKQYLLLDILKTVMMTDPYFLGIASLYSPTPWSWLSALSQVIPFATPFVRLLLSLAGVLSALSFIFSLCPLFFNFLLPRIMSQKTLTAITRSPLLEPWMYPPYNSPMTTSILDRGLPGFWGLYWHQLFRFGVSQPSVPIIKALHLAHRSTPAKAIQVMIAFTLSGLIHAGASYTTFQPSHPFTGPLPFFVFQGIAVMAQSTFSRWFSAHISDTRSWPRYLRRTLNGVVVLVWLYHTGPLLADDFAQCGIWLFEPVPVSLFRGLGLGVGGAGEGWWCWGLRGERFIGWWDDESGGGRWWRKGIAIY